MADQFQIVISSSIYVYCQSNHTPLSEAIYMFILIMTLSYQQFFVQNELYVSDILSVPTLIFVCPLAIIHSYVYYPYKNL